ncbi:glycoside hydrolase superfamily [Lipomyces doorenjongii]
MSNAHDQKDSETRYWKSTKKTTYIVVFLLVLSVTALATGLQRAWCWTHERKERSRPGKLNHATYDHSPCPAVGTSWQIELLYPLNDTSYDVGIYDIDLFDNDPSVITELRRQGRKVICYFSAGSYENWRPDADQFESSDLGNTLDGWPNERWLNISATNVRKIMLSLHDLAVAKRCEGVDPDNVDGYDNDNGLRLTEDDSVDFVNFLANATHARNMSLGLKNAGAIIPKVIGNMQWSVNEQCLAYDECDRYGAFTRVGKPVFHIEYPKGDNTNDNKPVTAAQKNLVCNNFDARNFSTVIKNMNLDNWVETC